MDKKNKTTGVLESRRRRQSKFGMDTGSSKMDPYSGRESSMPSSVRPSGKELAQEDLEAEEARLDATLEAWSRECQQRILQGQGNLGTEMSKGFGRA